MNKNKTKSKLVNIIIICAILVLIILIFGVKTYKDKQQNNILQTSSIIDNTKVLWGIKRNSNNEQPEVAEEDKNTLEQNGGIWVGKEETGNIYLTFDAGYEAGYTSTILNILKENNVTATFFITGHYFNTQEELIKQMIEEGHIVGNHTVNHKSMPDITEEEIKTEIMDLHNSIYEKFGYEMKYIRPPKGEFSAKSIVTSNLLGYTTVLWSFAYEDWDENNQPDPEEAKEKIISNVHNGEIILLHANSKTNVEILDFVIKEIKNMGYEFASLDEFE